MALEQHLLPQKFIIDNDINMNAHFNFIRFF
jgi:multiple sugar transport system permease protein